MKPEEWKWRYVLLLFDCLIPFGCYFNTDVPSALQTDLQGTDTGSCLNLTSNVTCCEGCLGLGPDRYNRLYSAFSWMNAGFALPAGYVIDRVGNRVGGVIATSVSSVGSFLFMVSSWPSIRMTSTMYPLMILGRVLVGAGTGTSLIVQDRVLAFWFQDKISFAYGFILMTIRLGNVSNFFLTPNIAKSMGLTASLWVGVAACILSLVSSFIMAWLDSQGTEQLDNQAKHNMKSSAFTLRDLGTLRLSYWIVCIMIVMHYSAFLPFIANGSKYIQDRYGYSKATSSYFNGATYDMCAFVSPLAGYLLYKINCTGLSLLVTCAVMVPIFPLLSYVPAIHPVILTMWLGMCCSFGPLCLWPCVLRVVPATKFGTACGIATFIQGLGVGMTNLAVGKILGFTEEPDMEVRIHKYQIMLLALLGTTVACFLLGCLLNIVDLIGDRKLNGRLSKSTSRRELKNLAREKSPLLSDEPSIQSYTSIDASEPSLQVPGIQ